MQNLASYVLSSWKSTYMSKTQIQIINYGYIIKTQRFELFFFVSRHFLIIYSDSYVLSTNTFFSFSCRLCVVTEKYVTIAVVFTSSWNMVNFIFSFNVNTLLSYGFTLLQYEYKYRAFIVPKLIFLYLIGFKSSVS